MDDRFACVCNLMDDDLQRDWDENGGSYSYNAVENALYKAYDAGARKHQPRYAECMELVDKLQNYNYSESLTKNDSFEIWETLSALKDALTKYDEESSS